MKILLIFTLFAAALAAAPEYPQMGPDIYSVTADGSKDITAALEVARAEHKRVLVDFGANWCIWCRRLHHTFETNPAVAAKLHRSFIVVMVDVNREHGTARNADLVRRYGNPTRFGIPVLVVLDKDGRQLTTEDSGLLEQGSGHSPQKILDFLSRWSG